KVCTRSQTGDSGGRDDLQRLAESGNTMAQRALAKMYLEEQPPRLEEAMRWLLKAAESGDADAQFAYASNLPRLRGETAGKEVVEWLTRAARQGHTDSQYRLGLLLYEGRLVPLDNVAAAQWILIAETKGSREA